MASLFLARRGGAAGFTRLVAIKMVHPRHAEDPGLIQMFVDEALLTARIDHPNVVHVEELGEHESAYYLVMEYVHGASLAQLMRVLGRAKRRLSPLVAVAICARVSEGLHAAHETTGDNGELLSIVHRDVSPQNILLSHKGHVKLIDFGIAKAHARGHESNVSSLKGKVRYMAPEQATTGNVDRRTDVYALGIVLWELLTMRRLFSGRNEFEILLSVRKPRIVPPSRYATEIPPELDAVVMRALHPDPAERYPNAKEFRRQLVRALPRSAAIDSAHLADLLVQVMGDELDKVRHALPQDISRVLRAELQRVVGLEKEERGNSGDPPSVEDAREPSGMVDVYTLRSGEIQFEEEDSPLPEDDEPPARGSDRPEGEPDATVRAERPAALAPRPAPQDQAEEPGDADETEIAPRKDIIAVARRAFDEAAAEAETSPRRTVQWPDALDPQRPMVDEESPTEVSDRQPLDNPYAYEQPVVPLPVMAAPDAGSRELARYGVALGASMCLGVLLALWGPSCEGERAVIETPAVLPTAAALPAPPTATPVPTRGSAAPDAGSGLGSSALDEDTEAQRDPATPRVRRGRGARRGARGGATHSPASGTTRPAIVGGVPIARDLDL